MIVGIGVDLVNMSELERMVKLPDDAFVTRTFTAQEIEQAEASAHRLAHYAGLFAAKEAVFKAVAHWTEKKAFDFRIVETLSEADGYPLIHVNEELQEILKEAGVENLFVSITHDGEYAVATVVAEG